MGGKAVTRLKEINEKLRNEINADGKAYISRRMLKKGLKRVYPVMPKRDIGRNEPCVCGSGKKFKQCCIKWKM